MDRDRKLNPAPFSIWGDLGKAGVIRFTDALVLEGSAPGLRLFQLDVKSVLKPTVLDFPTGKDDGRHK